MHGGLYGIARSVFLPVLKSCAVAIALATSISSVSAQARRPNIVLIVADDAGYADLGAFGGEINTPNIDSLAATGVRFTNFYVGPTCSPTRSMLLSGVDNHVAGLGNMAEWTASNQKGEPGYEGYLNHRVAPVAGLLKQAGYHTYMAGKWHLGEEPQHFPAARGFERDLTLIPGGGSHFEDMWGPKGERQFYTRNGKVITELRPGFHSTVDYTNAIIENIEEQKTDGKPFFAYLAYQAPHDPFHLPDDWLGKYKGRYDQGYDAVRAARIERMKRLGIVPESAKAFPRLPQIPEWSSLSADEKKMSARRMELYAAMLEHLDSNLGRLIRYLKDNNLYDDTIFIFMSDNGPEGTLWNLGAPWDNSKIENWGKKGSFVQYGAAWAQVSAGPFRMFKGYESEGGIRAPMIVSGRGVKGSGRVSTAVSHVMDIPATILNVANVAYPKTFDGNAIAPLQGKSLDPILSNRLASVRGPSDWLGFEVFGNRAIRMGDWKLLYLCKPAGPSDWQLYNLKNDPGEMIDLSARQPGIKAQLLRHWETYSRTNNVIIPSESPLCGKSG